MHPTCPWRQLRDRHDARCLGRFLESRWSPHSCLAPILCTSSHGRGWSRAGKLDGDKVSRYKRSSTIFPTLWKNFCLVSRRATGSSMTGSDRSTIVPTWHSQNHRSLVETDEWQSVRMNRWRCKKKEARVAGNPHNGRGSDGGSGEPRNGRMPGHMQ